MNTTTLAAPQHITSLATSAILVHVEMRVTTLSTSDEAVSAEVTDSKKADRDVGVFINKLVGKNEQLRRVMSYRATLGNWLSLITYDWGGGWRLLPAFRVGQFQQEFAAHDLEFRKRVDEFLVAYPDIVAAMAFKRGDLFRREDYPTVEQLRGKFSLRLMQQNVPTGDFRSAVAIDLATDLKLHYQRQVDGIVGGIRDTMAAQVTDYLTRLSKSCVVEDTVGADGKVKTKRGKVYEATIEQALDLCDAVATFNPAGDAKLEEVRLALSNLLRNINVPALKQSDTMRIDTKTQLDDILAKFRA